MDWLAKRFRFCTLCVYCIVCIRIVCISVYVCTQIKELLVDVRMKFVNWNRKIEKKLKLKLNRKPKSPISMRD